MVTTEVIHWAVCESNQEVPCRLDSDDYWAIVMVHVWSDVFPIEEASLNIGFLLLEGFPVGLRHTSMHKSTTKVIKVS